MGGHHLQKELLETTAATFIYDERHDTTYAYLPTLPRALHPDRFAYCLCVQFVES